MFITQGLKGIFHKNISTGLIYFNEEPPGGLYQLCESTILRHIKERDTEPL